MAASLEELVAEYDDGLALEHALTLPASFYVDGRLFELERRTTFSRTWQLAARADQVAEPGRYVTCEVAGEPIVVVRGGDGMLRGFFNVCRHHAAAVMTAPEGQAPHMRCPYHGWTYSLEGALKGTPDFAGVCGFDKAQNGLVPVDLDEWEGFVFVRLEPGGPSFRDSIGEALVGEVAALDLGALSFLERRRYLLDCNWKVFVENYLDGGYHVPHLHKGLGSVLDHSAYAIENGARHCLQSSPIVRAAAAEPETAAVRQGDKALYYWLHPNMMINWYQGLMDVNLVRPLAVDRTEVIFDFYFADVASPEAREQNRASIAVGQRIQDEDVDICVSVQRGLRSRAYRAGRLSVRREAGEHLFHRLLVADLKSGLRSR
jgi:choline monooxygenase